MKKYLISLDKDIKRRELFFCQPNTQDFEVFSAFNTMNDELSDLSLRFDLTRFEKQYNRKVTKGEIGCTLSHLGAYQSILQNDDIQEDEYCLICEDDALFCADFQQELDKVIVVSQADIVLVGQSKIAEFNDFELEINYPTTLKFLQKKLVNSPFTVVYPYQNYFAGTVAYLIKKSAARKIIAQISVQSLPYWLADDFILFGGTFKLDIKLVRPLMAIENPQLMSNLEAIRGSVANNLLKKSLKYPLKKLLAIKRNLGK
ncbi:glycosyltransferase family 25 protein [Ursidibacter maritimus]|uniref:glycosyltransferase family 25 protein n=1 Tax=Ursidibacter maritimus TaxID=1331689 RepID=UPI001C491A23|nr:glycosyltransferase family 25 protein [Ursidibacter maritimus]MBV6541660.1 glycosyltransferase family 25 protein [Ursidibacter maritimus]